MPTLDPGLASTIMLDFGVGFGSDFDTHAAISDIEDAVLTTVDNPTAEVTVKMLVQERVILFIEGLVVPQSMLDNIFAAIVAVRCKGLPEQDCTVTEVVSSRRRLQDTSQVAVDVVFTIREDTDVPELVPFNTTDFVDQSNAEVEGEGVLVAVNALDRETSSQVQVRIDEDSPEEDFEAVETAVEDTDTLEANIASSTGVAVEVDQVAGATPTQSPASSVVDDGNADSGLSTGAIIGITFGVSIIVIAVAVAVVVAFKKAESSSRDGRPDLEIAYGNTSSI